MKRQIPMDSSQWAQADRQVQVITGKSSVKLISVFKFQQSQLNFDAMLLKNGKDKTWIDATINVTDFSKEYYRQVVDKVIPLEDVILYSGHVNIHKYSNQPYKIFTFLLSKVCLGTAANASTPKTQDCDSILIPPQSQQAFQYNFFVKQHWQYQVRYEVNFTISEQKEFKLTQFSCSNCQNRTPVIYCGTQKLYFCEDCCNDHHKTKLMQSHALETIDKVNTLENCKSHNQKFELYCLKCQKYLCSLCVQKGIHAQGSDHVIKPIRYYYEELIQNIDVIPKKSLQKIEVLLYNLNIKRKQIQDNERQVRNEIQRQYKKCLNMLQEETAKKYQILDTNQLELNLLKDKITWNQSFCVFQSNALKPIHFFKSQNIFQEEMKKLKVSDFEAVLNCKPDILYRSINVVGTKDSIQKNSQLKKQMEQQNKSYTKSPSQSQIKKNQSRLKQHHQDEKARPANIFAFDPLAQPPPKGSLLNDLSNCGLKFFQIKSK